MGTKAAWNMLDDTQPDSCMTLGVKQEASPERQGWALQSNGQVL